MFTVFFSVQYVFLYYLLFAQHLIDGEGDSSAISGVYYKFLTNFITIQQQHGTVCDWHAHNSLCLTLPLLVAELQDPLYVLFGHWVIIFKWLK